jgi:hypothetical protein
MIKLLKFSRLSRPEVGQIILCFCEDMCTCLASKLLRINRNTV